MALVTSDSGRGNGKGMFGIERFIAQANGFHAALDAYFEHRTISLGFGLLFSAFVLLVRYMFCQNSNLIPC